MERYKLIPHTADIAIRANGRDLKELFANAAFGMFDIIADLDGITTSLSMDITLTGTPAELLLVRWLDELLYNFYTKGIIFSRFEVLTVDQDRLTARVYGRHVGENRNRLKTEIKAVTFHDLTIREENGVFGVEIIFDI
ncbi:MAG: archease [Candidatus Omnitrophica bacterium]|nr:archease [Candidatus Omnitrophota bacterium]